MFFEFIWRDCIIAKLYNDEKHKAVNSTKSIKYYDTIICPDRPNSLYSISRSVSSSYWQKLI